MYISEESIKLEYVRTSKLGKEHTHTRTKRIITFRCDNCNEIFTRERSKISPKRLSNRYFHVCGNCDAKRFAQNKGIEKKQIWDMPASSLKPVGRI